MMYKRLVLVTGFLFCILVVYGAFLHRKNPVHSMLDVGSFPQMGSQKAPVQMLVFEDLRCPECRNFHLQVLPEVKTRFIDTGRVKCSYVLLSFVEHSLPLAKTCLAVGEVRPEKFFSFVDALYRTELPPGSTGEEYLAEFSKTDRKMIQKIAQEKRLQEVLEAHDQFAENLMKEDFGTPTVYINGREVKHLTVDALERAIENAKI